jgi:uncharacterized protein YbjQ (UPF0145 family)
MLVTTTYAVEGYRIVEYKGIVRGIIVRSPTIAQGFVGGIVGIVGGQNEPYREMCEQTRLEAYADMVRHAQAMGANAVVGMYYDATDVVSQRNATEVLCYGTAVVIAPIA